MSTKRTDVIAAGKRYAQDNSAQPLLRSSDDYGKALDLAIKALDSDLPNLRVVHYTVLAASFRFILAGAGAILSGLDAWFDGRSSLQAVWHPYDTTIQNQAPLDPNDYRVVREPSLVVLQLLTRTPSSGILRLEFVSPHVVDVSDTAKTSVLAGDVEALNLLTGIKILEIAAAGAAQNTGSTGLPSDVVDRRTQSDVFASRVRDLYKDYAVLVGKPDASAQGAPVGAGVVKDLDVDSSHVWGMIWHPKGSR